MTEDLATLAMGTMPPTTRPLLGLTILLVEDSRFASDAIRLLCLRSGARIRRADCLASARKHLKVYRPSAVIIDLGLPDGSGTELIRELTTVPRTVNVVLATSGDDGAADAARRVGADGFLAKPVAGLAAFQQAILDPLADPARAAIRALPDEEIKADPIALRDDLRHVADVLRNNPDPETLKYLAQFVGGVARSAADIRLANAARNLAQSGAREHAAGQLAGMLDRRLAEPLQM